MATASSKTAKAGSETTPAPLGVVPFDPSVLMAMNSANVEAFSRMSDVMMKGVATFNEELSRFANMRFNEDVEAQKSFMACRSPAEAFNIYSDFMQNTMREYFEEMGTLTGMAAELTQQSWTPIEERAKEAVKSMNGDSGAK